MSDQSIIISLHFLEPFRAAEWIKPSLRNSKNERFSRIQSFARWHKSDKNGAGNPYITGTLLRSKVIQAAEHLLALTNDKLCCPGKFYTKENGHLDHLRQRSTHWSGATQECSADAPCPLCQLLGVHDNAKRSADNKPKLGDSFHIHFGNLNPNPKTLYHSIRDIGDQRALNRVDQYTGKAHDYFKIWEIDHERIPVFQGNITISKEITPEAIRLLTDSLHFIDSLCGAMCVIRTDDSANEKPAFCEPKDKNQTAEKDAEAIKKIVKNPDRLRVIADAIRSLRNRIPDQLELPLDHEGKENHYIWDLSQKENGRKEGRSIREILAEAAVYQHAWRQYCETLGESLYRGSKEPSGGIQIAKRILGDADFEGQPNREIEPVATAAEVLKETVFVGKLKSLTPFYFGLEITDSLQTSLSVLLDYKNRYRIPRSAIRGILRRDLKAVIGTGCNVELGGRPCPCPVCRIMRGVTIRDMRSRYSEPPEIRQRIRINPYTGTAAEGALFDMEVGPEGLEFDFELRYRGKTDAPEELKNVLKWWTEGQAFLSGAASSGKGRFILSDLKSLEVLNTERLKTYLENHGWRDKIEQLKMNDEPLEINGYKEPAWEKVRITITLSSPFLNGDPIRALIEKDGGDIVSFRKYIHGQSKEIYALKAESFRGIVRSAVARSGKGKDAVTGEIGPLSTLTHQDCECLLCRLFGSEYETGKLRFEDLVFDPQPETSKLFDHVAIDRFTSGAVEKKKFNDQSLPGSQNHQLKLTGLMWIKKDIRSDEVKALYQALCDIQHGFYPLGGKVGVGYGWVSELIVMENSGILPELTPSANKPQSPNTLEKPSSSVALELDDNAFYYPHYFLKPAAEVQREPVPTGHQAIYQDGLLTGKITCRLTTKTPLIIPDTEENDAFGLSGTTPDHKSHRFFSVNGDIMIPGSEIRGMISSVYEAITNSCFRIFHEKYRLSWRMEAVGAELKKFKPGRITDDGQHIEEMVEYRYPFYDQNCLDESSQNQLFEQWNGSIKLTNGSLDQIEKEFAGIKNKLISLVGKTYKNKELFLEDVRSKVGGLSRKKTNQSDGKGKSKSPIPLILKYAVIEGKGVSEYNHPTMTDRMLLTLAEYNRTHNYGKQEHSYQIIKPDPKLKPSASFMFAAAPSENQNIEKKLIVHKDAKGYLKVSGPNKIEKENKIIEEYAKELPDELIHQRVYLRKIFVANAPKRKNRDRLIPEFVWCDKHNGITYVMNKRCERIFVRPQGRFGKQIAMSELAKRRYQILIEEYQKNAEQQKTPRVFQTKLPELKPGELVYFREEKDKDGTYEAVEIIPVRISRNVDDRVIADRIAPQLRPCHGDWIEDEDLSALENYPEKRLFTRNPDGLCPACRLFGTGSYKGRVQFGFASLTHDAKWTKPADDPKDRSVTLPLLERPRPTWSIPKPETDKPDDRKVPGRKFYIHHSGWKDVLDSKHPGTGAPIEKTANNRTVEPLSEGNEFRFDIYFENLEPYELGLLIYVLQLEQGLAHKLGMAKSMGFGSVEIDIENVELRVESGLLKNANQEISHWILCGKQQVSEWFNKEWKTIQHIQDLIRLLSVPKNQNLKVFYPPLEKSEDSTIPSYKDLKKFEKPDEKTRMLAKRINMLTTPWTPLKKE